MGRILKVNLKFGGVFLYLVLSVFSLLGSLSLVSCAGSAASAKTSGTSGLCVRVPKTSSSPQNRAAQYNLSDLEVFTVIVESGRFSKSKSCGQDEILEFTDLPVGHYTVTAIVKNADGTVTGRGDTTSVDIEADVMKEVTISIHRLTHYTIQFYTNLAAATPLSVEVSNGEKLPKPANPTNPDLNYEFAGWFVGTTGADGAVTYAASAYNFDTPVSSEFNLYAKWVWRSSSLVGLLADFTWATFKANTPSTPYTVRLSGLSTSDCATLASLIGGASNKGVYINLDLSVSGISNISDNAFNADTNSALATYLTGIVLPDGLASVGHNAFKGCTNLSGSVTIPATCTCIGMCPFQNTGVTSLVDADGSRWWYRKNTSDGSVVGDGYGWDGTLNSSGAIEALNRSDLGSLYYGP